MKNGSMYKLEFGYGFGGESGSTRVRWTDGELEGSSDIYRITGLLNMRNHGDYGYLQHELVNADRAESAAFCTRYVIEAVEQTGSGAILRLRNQSTNRVGDAVLTEI